MEVMLFLDVHHEGPSIGTLDNFHVPIMQLLHSRWGVPDLLRPYQRLAAGIFPFYVLLFKLRHGLNLEELSNSDTEHFSLPSMLVGYYQLTGTGTLMCWYNKRGDRLRCLFSQLGNGLPAFFASCLARARARLIL